MKKILFLTFAILIVSTMVIAQTQGTAFMSGAKHDLRVNSGKTTQDSIAGASDRLCSYCHSPHIPAAGIKDPLWARAAKGGTSNWGKYSGQQLDAEVVDPSNPTSDQHKNESNMCISCHDGTAMYTSASYVKRPHVSGNSNWTGGTPVTFTARKSNYGTRGNNAIVGGTNYVDLSHTHPVNFDYSDAVTADGALYTAINAKYVYHDGTQKIGRLFNDKVQCSSCHNPHMTDTKMVQGTLADGKLCVSCHKK